MNNIQITVDRKELEAFRSQLTQNKFTRNVRRAGTEAIRRIKARSVEDVRSRKRVKVSTINSRLPVVYPPKSASVDDMQWKMRVSGKPAGLGQFPIRQDRKGVVAQINVGKPVLIERAFIRSIGGVRQVFSRQKDNSEVGPSKRGGVKLVDRYGINRLVSSSVFDTFKDPGFIEYLSTIGSSVFMTAFIRNSKKG